MSSPKNSRFTTFRAKEILTVPNRVGSVEVNPFSGYVSSQFFLLTFSVILLNVSFWSHSKLLWTEIVSNDLGHIKVSDTNGKNVKEFFKYENARKKRDTEPDDCNCSKNVILASSMSLDWSSKIFEPKVVWADGEKGHIWSTDLSGCKCNILVNASETINKG